MIFVYQNILAWSHVIIKGRVLIKTNIDAKIEKILTEEGAVQLTNPYRPGAGSPPDFLAGRDSLIEQAVKDIDTVIKTGFASHTLYWGLRGVGKTVLLVELENIFEQKKNVFCAKIECMDDSSLSKNLAYHIDEFVKYLEGKHSIASKAKELLSLLRNFVVTWSPSSAGDIGTISLSMQPTEDKPKLIKNYEIDLTQLLISAGQLAQEHEMCICLIIDELQALKKNEFLAFVSAMHRINQKRLPIIVFAAALPTIHRLGATVKSYFERLFVCPNIDRLDKRYTQEALTKPAMQHGVYYTIEAQELVFERTKGYPYFVQMYGKWLWDNRENDCIIDENCARGSAYGSYIENLDNSFFKARYDRVTAKEKEFLFAMAMCNNHNKDLECYKVSRVAENLGKNLNSVSVVRNNLIKKGLIYAPSVGEVAFTVPLFHLYLLRLDVNGKGAFPSSVLRY